MANVVTNAAKTDFVTGALPWVSGDVRVGLLVGASAIPAGCLDPDLNDVAGLLAVSGATECTATNYARKTTSSRSATKDTVNDRVNVDFANVTWTSLGGAVNNTVQALFVYLEGASDAARRLVSVHELTATPTNGGDFTVNTPNDVIRMS
jgi:hypothetical protein